MRFPVVRFLLALSAMLAVLAVAWRWRPDAPALFRAGGFQLVNRDAPTTFVLPPPALPPLRSYLELPERPDVVGEAAPVEAHPPGLRPGPPPRRITNAPPPVLTAASWLVMDEDSGQVLLAHHGHRRHAPASVTKIMTALLAIQLGKLDAVVIADVLGADIPDSTLVGLTPGDQLTLRDLVYGLMLHSGNDAAVQIGRVIAGGDAAFVELMNRRAEELGLRDTHFANPHGLDQERHFSSAYDLAALSRYAMSYGAFATVVQAKDWRVQGPPSYGMFNGNRLLREVEGADGVKIGNTDLGGQTIVGSVTRGGHRVYVVVLGARDRIADSKRLLDSIFANYRWE